MEKGFRISRPMLFYSLLNIGLWVQFVCVQGYASVLLLDRGFSSYEIGIVLALGNLFSVIFQPALSSATDKGLVSVNKLLVLLEILIAAGFILFVVLSGKIILGILYVLLFVGLNNLPPFSNNLGMIYASKNIGVDYGKARGLGSLAYALVSMALGIILGGAGIISIPVCTLIFAFVAILAVIKLPADVKEEAGDVLENSGNSGSYLSFCKNNPFLIIFVIGVCLIFTMHQILNVYAYQIAVNAGGSEADMGFMLGLAAFVEIFILFTFIYMEKVGGPGLWLIISVIGFSLKAVVILVARSIPLLLLAYAMQAIGYAIYVPASVSFADKIFSGNDKNKVQGMVYTVAICIGGVIGSLAGGYLIDSYGVSLMLTVGCIISVIGTVLSIIGVRGMLIKNKSA